VEKNKAGERGKVMGGWGAFFCFVFVFGYFLRQDLAM
jgi:hypothetical protein